MPYAYLPYYGIITLLVNGSALYKKNATCFDEALERIVSSGSFCKQYVMLLKPLR